MNQNCSSATKTGYPVRYFDQIQQSNITTLTQTDSNVYADNYVAYPPTSSYLHNQQLYDNSYNQALTDYATNQCFQNQSSNKITSNRNNKRKTPYTKGNVMTLYCEICKISCAGEQSYKDHCDGQKHKKKELNLKNGTTTPAASNNGQKSLFFCDVCMVPCSGADSYTAHINGKSHIKVCNLQLKMGRDLPNDLITTPSMKSAAQMTKLTQQYAPSTNDTIKVIGTPAINFVKGGSLKSMTCDSDAVIEECSKDDKIEETNGNISTEQLNDQSLNVSVTESNTSIASQSQIDLINDTTINNDQIPLLGDPPQLPMSSISIASSEPIGLEYINEFTISNSKAIYFSCSLCNCEFSEINAKEQHVRGKRHHKNYKAQNGKKSRSQMKLPVNNSIGKSTRKAVLKGKPPSFNQLLEKIPLNQVNQIPMNHISQPLVNYPTSIDIPINQRIDLQMSTPIYLNKSSQSTQVDDESFQTNMDISFLDDTFVEPKFDTLDNKYVFKKNSEIVPLDDDLKQYYRHISNVERSLKQVSDDLLRDVDSLKEILKDQPVQKGDRVVQGEIRTGLFGKKLMLRNENQIDLILLSSVKPTVPLLRKLIEVLKIKLDLFENDKYTSEENIDEASIDVRTATETSTLLIRITLTSLNIRNSINGQPELPASKDPDEMLNKQKCLDALTALRRFKWFQVKVAPFNPCPMIIRLLRDLTKRIDLWSPLNCWSLELICERVMSSCLNRPSPFEAFKLILQTLASGVLIKENKDDILIVDPCEMEKVDALGYLTDKQREEITESAQTLVQFIAFNKIYKVLGTEIIQIDQMKTEKVNNITTDDTTNNNGTSYDKSHNNNGDVQIETISEK